MNELKVFQNTEFGELGVMEIEGKSYFQATACAKMLGYANPKKAILDHCKGVTKRDLLTNGGRQTINLIPEGDLYRLIVSSRLPSAERFEKWVFDEVLPEIRKRGAYAPDMGTIVAAAVKETIQQVMPLLQEAARRADTYHPYGEETAGYERIRRKPLPSIAGLLADETRQDLEDVILEGKMTYVEIGAYMLDRYGVKISKSSVHRYASKLFDTMEQCGERAYIGRLRNHPACRDTQTQGKNAL